MNPHVCLLCFSTQGTRVKGGMQRWYWLRYQGERVGPFCSRSHAGEADAFGIDKLYRLHFWRWVEQQRPEHEGAWRFHYATATPTPDGCGQHTFVTYGCLDCAKAQLTWLPLAEPAAPTMGLH